ncbi:hypothetical protein JQ557_10325 [Bradyrhizobium sp. U87765 SZCCT0131]|uniref:hypothetical protein n=1 Tax=unclassified Bradyrhizobium TaxID=2631580 RepID=UPI001BA6B3C9|nr:MULTISPECIES: hypothetical protein [unclassified Bradyrhizobium]MBR1218386.1 hypothetical protein [Bradyrhizobium sp. U87765 SZCCT0131]MBR1260668.1 hypothetical protein [Bradyrhizobium sp. U87765 SZCCT0134]MBR1303884.1 hypothetical protein [Bradyrhizobium sp. U87765 SZCCT0110]MBR1319490.1 hypothetical protein [Bradyrhizobium sp. U87765 SZCCT0109]MBR1347815.1 hypothetical protein [Bradyrhizobium sp. U87765 SZCCT0048]
MTVDSPAERLRRHPEFQAVLGMFCDRLVAPLRGQRVMIKLFGQRAPTEIAGLIVMMHFTAQSRSGRPTLTRIQARLPGARRIAAFVALLRGFGLVRSERDPADARIRYLVPGDQIVDGLRDWLAVHLDCYGRLAPGDAYLFDRLRSDRVFYEEMIRQCEPWLDRANRPLTCFPDLNWLDEHDSGIHLVLTLVEAWKRRQSAVWIEVSSMDLARSLGVSKSHIRNLMNLMELRGLVRHDASRQRIQLAARLVDAVEGWFCRQVIWLASAARRAEAVVATPDQR